MSLSLYDVTIPTFLHSLRSLKAILEKGRGAAPRHASSIPTSSFPRLYPDMLPFARQIQIAERRRRGARLRA